MSISVDEDGIGFVIRKFNDHGLVIAELKLGGEDILILAQSAQLLRSRVLQRIQPAGGMHSAVYSTIVDSIGLHEASLADGLLLTLGSPNGAQTHYSLTQEMARDLVDRIPPLLDHMAASKLPEQ